MCCASGPSRVSRARGPRSSTWLCAAPMSGSSGPLTDSTAPPDRDSMWQAAARPAVVDASMSGVPSTVGDVPTTIDIYPAMEHMPLAEDTRARTQELFQQLFDRRGIASTIEVKAFYPNAEPGAIRYVDRGLRWHTGLDLGFGYWIDGEWDFSSWPSCLAVEADDFVTEAGTVWPCRMIVRRRRAITPLQSTSSPRPCHGGRRSASLER